jgi:AcrR family transcriptional regulator
MRRGGRPRDPEADRALLAAALDILQQQGYAGLSMLGVAKRAGVSATTLYRRWTSKEDLVAAAVVHLSPLVEQPDTGNLHDDLRAVMRERAKSMRGDEGHVLIGLVAEMVKNPRAFAAIKERLTQSNLQVVIDLLQRAMDRGEIPHTDLELALDFVTGPFWAKLFAGSVPTDKFVDDILPMLVAALKAAPVRPTARTTNPATPRRAKAPPIRSFGKSSTHAEAKFRPRTRPADDGQGRRRLCQ